ncbi:DUF257 family protein [Pyrococcus horikoshii]|uniref:KaiC-like domain-containing protein n=2 Tax=Pyrococcus horikoshii TaxID=53953 RepID=O58889_PYRHO|nr:DUF257 family protein [Pyrococcus horikoshii]BAA30245.1 221aa long hypothetical protein [Pyrococcus horikoshii OT3]HII61815.1 DUF257 family protein [Pyrococcus horikoshii]
MLTFEELLDEIKFGETTILFYPGLSYIREFIILKILNHAKIRNIPVIIDDNLDALSIVSRNLKILGFAEDFQDAYVVKTGGRQNIGKIITRVRLHPDPRVYIQEYSENIQRSLKEHRIERFINIVLGIEDLFRYLNSPHEVYLLVLAIQRFLGDKRRKAFYIVNENSLKVLPPQVYLELMRVATTIIRAVPNFITANLTIIKSLNPGLIGKEISLELEVER